MAPSSPATRLTARLTARLAVIVDDLVAGVLVPLRLLGLRLQLALQILDFNLLPRDGIVAVVPQHHLQATFTDAAVGLLIELDKGMRHQGSEVVGNSSNWK